MIADRDKRLGRRKPVVKAPQKIERDDGVKRTAAKRPLSSAGLALATFGKPRTAPPNARRNELELATRIAGVGLSFFYQVRCREG